HLEEVYKATTDHLDWVNPEGQQYPHNLLQPLPLIPDNRGRSVIPFEHFINNDLEYLRGGALSRKYTTSVTKTKAADYGESVLDVCSKRRIIAVTELKIVEWHNYKHLDWISRRMEDLQLGVESYQKSDGTLNDVRNALDECLKGIRMQYLPTTIWKRWDNTRAAAMIQAIDKMLKTRRIMRSLERFVGGRQGFIYQNKDKKNRLMRINELHKFSDGTLNDVRNALDDRLKGIQMQYLPSIIWRKGDKDRAAAMIQAIEKMLKTRRIMRSLEKFVGGRLHSSLNMYYVYGAHVKGELFSDDENCSRCKHFDIHIKHRKLTNLTIEECFAFNISLRMFTKSIVIQRHVEDLQLGVKSYQKKLNLTKQDTYRSDLKHKEAYTAYSNLRGFIYLNKDKLNRLMRIDELHKFSDDTLNDVRTALDDRLKGIRMKYLPQTIWKRSDKERAAIMIQAIDKQLKTKRIM
nr:hypothetical protein [Tanacetum cinerariifolium]